jgi:hypothetical protein
VYCTYSFFFVNSTKTRNIQKHCVVQQKVIQQKDEF